MLTFILFFGGDPFARLKAKAFSAAFNQNVAGADFDNFHTADDGAGRNNLAVNDRPREAVFSDAHAMADDRDFREAAFVAKHHKIAEFLGFRKKGRLIEIRRNLVEERRNLDGRMTNPDCAEKETGNGRSEQKNKQNPFKPRRSFPYRNFFSLKNWFHNVSFLNCWKKVLSSVLKANTFLEGHRAT
ncbi:MAG: hypothetical protein WCH86_03490 [Kiritimatiellales bacterium]